MRNTACVLLILLICLAFAGLGRAGARRLPGQVYFWCNQHLTGTEVAVSTTGAPAETHSVLLYNMATSVHRVDLALLLLNLPYAAPLRIQKGRTRLTLQPFTSCLIQMP